jgi:hypothetical protein
MAVGKNCHTTAECLALYDQPEVASGPLRQPQPGGQASALNPGLTRFHNREASRPQPDGGFG